MSIKPEHAEVVDRWRLGEISVAEMLDEIARMQAAEAEAALRATCPTCGGQWMSVLTHGGELDAADERAST